MELISFEVVRTLVLERADGRRFRVESQREVKSQPKFRACVFDVETDGHAITLKQRLVTPLHGSESEANTEAILAVTQAP